VGKCSEKNGTRFRVNERGGNADRKSLIHIHLDVI
jgi:hypothetical protein